jgi:hypothetical protein
MEETSDPIEVIPSENRALVFIGKPPKRFGIAWGGKDGKIVTFKNMVEEKSLSALRLEKRSNSLRDVYVNHKSEPPAILIMDWVEQKISSAGRQLYGSPTVRLQMDESKPDYHTV